MSRKKEYQSILPDLPPQEQETDSKYTDEFSLQSQAKAEEAPADNSPVVKKDGDWVWVKIDEAMLCKECGENERDISRGEDFPYCKQCEKQRYRYPFSGWAVLAVAIMVACAVLGGFMLPSAAENAVDIHAADVYLNEGKLSSAGTAYANLYSKDESNKYVAKRLVNILYESGNWQNIVSVIDKTFTEYDLKLKTNEKLLNLRNEVAVYNSTYEQANKIYTELETSATYEDAIGRLEALSGQLNQPCIEYFRYKFAVLFDRNQAEVYTMISKAYDQYPSYDWLLLAPKASAERQMQLYEDAMQSATALLSENTENAEAYRQLSIAYLLKEDYESAIGFATNSYLLKKTDDAANVLLAAYLAKGDEEQYESFLAEMSNSGLEPDYFIYQLQAGETTVKDIFLEEAE